MRSLSGNEKENGKVGSPILPHTNFSLRAGQINQLILLVDAQFLGMFHFPIVTSGFNRAPYYKNYKQCILYINTNFIIITIIIIIDMTNSW